MNDRITVIDTDYNAAGLCGMCGSGELDLLCFIEFARLNGLSEYGPITILVANESKGRLWAEFIEYLQSSEVPNKNLSHLIDVPIAVPSGSAEPKVSNGAGSRYDGPVYDKTAYIRLYFSPDGEVHTLEAKAQILHDVLTGVHAEVQKENKGNTCTSSIIINTAPGHYKPLLDKLVGAHPNIVINWISITADSAQTYRDERVHGKK